MVVGAASAAAGSSPLTRGKRLQGEADPVARRLIPAHAGKTPIRGRVNRPARAHPRSRGENAAYVGDVPNDTGSSPLTRGKLFVASLGANRRRLIPAHAGKTVRGHGYAAGAGAHPRSRGENKNFADGFDGTAGSSPLTRGKRSQGERSARVVGLIPAHAGKTSLACSSTPPQRAHPRSRGENSETVESSSPGPGSSPLTRGKRGSCRCLRRCWRLIPAHAGKTSGGRAARPPWPAHPRSRGENSLTETAQQIDWGSSPLTRGKRHPGVLARAPARLIPAHAGKTRLALSSA